MFKVDWSDIALKLQSILLEKSKSDALLKMKADIYLLNVANGQSVEESWKKADEQTAYFEKKVNDSRT
jgi:hypothetical protein